MSTSKSNARNTGNRLAKNADNNAAGRETSKRSDVGYARPPRDHQFKPGQSGNPKGRPKGAKNESTILREMLARKILIKVHGKSRHTTIFEAILLRIIEDALRGDLKSAAFTLNRYGNLVSGEVPSTATESNDQEIIDNYNQKIIADLEKKK
jgi:hypothetical protein